MKKLLLLAFALLLLAGLGLFVAVRVLLSPDTVRSAIEVQAGAALGMPVKVGAASVYLWPRAGVTLDQVVVGEPAQVTLRRAQVTTGLRPLLSRRVEDAEVVIEDSRLDLPKFLATLDALVSAGPASTTASSPSSPSSPSSAPSSSVASSGFTIVSIRAIGLRNVTLVAGGREANVTVESSLAGDRLEIARLSARSEESTLEATGAIESLARRIVRLKIEAERLDLDGLLQFASALSGASASPANATNRTGAGAAGAASLDLQADVRAATGRLAGLTFTGLETKIAVTPAQVTLAPLALRTLGGQVNGDVAVRLAGVQPELTLTGTFDGLDLQQVSAFAGQPSAVTGTLNGRVRVSGRGLDPATALPAATGTADVALLDGRMPGLHLVRPVVLAFGRPQESAPAADAGGGERFDRISATLAIARGQIRTDNLRFASRDVDMDGTGTLTVPQGALNMKVNLRLSEELSAQAGRDLVRYAHEANRVLLPATITGTVAAPAVMIDEQQAVRRALRNEVEDRAKSLFERLLPGKRPK